MKNINFIFRGENYLISTFRKNLITNKYLSWLNNKKIMQYSERRYIKYTKKNCIKFFEEIKKNKNLFLAIHHVSKLKKVHIGNSIIYLDYNNKLAEISILIGDKRFLNKGLSSFLWGFFINYLFKKYKFRLIISGTMSVNKAMVRVFLKNKMKIAVNPKRYLYKNREVDEIYAYISKKN